jgi:hypothetical protein
MNPVKHVSPGHDQKVRSFRGFRAFRGLGSETRKRRDHHKHQKHGTLNSKVGDGTFTLFKKSGFPLRNLLNLWILFFFCFLIRQGMKPELKSADVADFSFLIPGSLGLPTWEFKVHESRETRFTWTNQKVRSFRAFRG